MRLGHCFAMIISVLSDISRHPFKFSSSRLLGKRLAALSKCSSVNGVNSKFNVLILKVAIAK